MSDELLVGEGVEVVKSERLRFGETIDDELLQIGFEDSEFRDRLFQKALRGREVSIPDLLMWSLAGSVLGAASTDDVQYPHDGSGGRTRERDWSSESVTEIGLTEADRAKMWRQSRELTTRDGMIGSLIRRMLVHICGRGPWLQVVKPKEQNDPRASYANLLEKRQMAILPNFPQIAHLIVQQTLIHGTLPILHFPLNSATGARSQLRPLIPDYLTKMQEADSWSLMPVVSGYRFEVLRSVEVPGGLVPPSCCTLSRIHQGMNDGKWGISVPFQIIAELSRFTDWLEQRRFRSRIDNIVLIMRYLKGTSTLSKHEIPLRPMVVDARMDEEKWDLLNLASGSSSRDATGGDGGEFRMRLSAVSGWPEHFLTGNAQYAAQMGKDSFPAALLEYYQDVFTWILLEVAAKTLGCNRADLRILWPPVDMRDRPAKVSECSTLSKDRLISRAEVHRQLGYDHDLNEHELARELEEELRAGPSGGAAGFGSMGVGGLGLSDVAAPGQGAPTVAPPAQVPAVPGAPAKGAAAPAATTVPSGATVTLPSALPGVTLLMAAVNPESFSGKLRSLGGVSPLGVSTESISDEIPELKVVVVGVDYGFAAEGAAIVGGLSEAGDLVFPGEMTFHRVPSVGIADTLDQVKRRYPVLRHVFTGSDEPELTDTLRKRGYEAVAKHLGPERTAEFVKGTRRRIIISSQCVELLADLFPELADRVAGRHTTRGRTDHSDAWRYAFIGLLELAGDIGQL